LPKASLYTPISDDNKGARMLAQMGWKKGEGLGKDGTGILDPVKAESYGQSAGIGSTAKRDLGGSDGSYRTRTIDAVKHLKKVKYFRYEKKTQCLYHLKLYWMTIQRLNPRVLSSLQPLIYFGY
ncbi:hypothetical protein BDF21DRAFT_341351, partial [Thamnidium elegans]